MNADQKRAGRLNTLYNMADSGKYTWAQLTTHAKSMGVTRETAKGYVDAVEAQLRKNGRLK